MTQWQSIETAPKDGTRILLYYPVGRLFSSQDTVVVGWWYADEYAKKPKPYWQSDFGFVGVKEHRISSPTYWMPLPAAPSEDNG